MALSTRTVILAGIAVWFALLHGRLTASPVSAGIAHVKRSVNELNQSYDYIVIGGGTSGLAVANRLSEDATKTVLVVELGYFADEPCIWMPLTTVSSPNSACAKHRFNISSVPQYEINDLVYKYSLGACVGGSSAVNGMVFDRGTRADYDAWQELGNPGWGWDGLFPYLLKSVTFTPPNEMDKDRFGYTWNGSAYGNGPMQASLPPFQWPTQNYSWSAWEDMGIPLVPEHALGDAIGRFWAPSSEHPVNRTRSYSRYGYYDPIASRSNYHLLIGHKAERLMLSSQNEVAGVIIHQRDRPEEKITVKAQKETVLAAGAAHTPQILQLSGIGPKEILKAAKVEVQVDLPGVGHNFQDHPQAYLTCNSSGLTLNTQYFDVDPITQDLWPNPGTLTNNATFHAEAQAQYDANKTGPLTLALNSGFVFLPLNTIHSSPTSFHTKLESQPVDAYLPANVPASVIAGYKAQKRILARLYKNSHAAVYESTVGGVCSRTTVLQKPLSRGTIHINASDPYGDPVVDFRAFTNPLDFEQALESIKYTRRYFKSPKFAPLAPVESTPGANVTDDDTVGLMAHLRRTSGPTSFHVSGTAAMMSRELGGVVGSDLKVYGVSGLSVVDASLMPLIPATHLSATVYAVAEKAADIIKSRA